jgi:hypothetical protein
MEQSRWKSKIAWAAVAALIGFIMKEWVGWEIPGWDRFIELLFGALMAFSIFNDPKNKTGY